MDTLKLYIQITYETGDSFNTHIEQQNIEYNFTKFTIMKKNMKRIRDHYAWVQDKYNYQRFTPKNLVEEPKWHKGLSESQIKIFTDNNKEVLYNCFWIGFFEKLRNVRIVSEEIYFL
jgi:hypothetical protein